MKDSTLTVKDFPNLKNAFKRGELIIDKTKERISENLKKGIISEEIFCEANDIIDSVEKGKRTQVGEIKKFEGNKYQKTEKGWTAVKEEKAVISKLL
ncbi:hypothetical protein [Dysgonomonas sp. BGC7]|uniref:hypothetical protein n=1 Tax=Dysgonomonas sp. BGC7 TaxID=1658008 RepID=UPI000B305ECC|nr:hypothetical protein [Dysgonomonas sp. BGC7]MBD8390376.1 hypothetical protein [Dysgonomonas sp. BGC7]